VVVAPAPGMVVMGAPAMVAAGHSSMAMVCPACRSPMTTNVTYEPGAFAYLIAAGLCFIGCWPFCIVPWCMPNCEDARHTCPACNATVAVDPGSC